MADSKLVDLTADASPTGDDLIYVVNDPSGTPADRKVTLTNLAGSAAFTGAFVGQYATANRPSAAANTGKVLWDTDLGAFYESNGTTWDALPSGGGGTVDVVSNVATSRVLGRVTAGSGDSEELTAAQVRTLLNVEDGADVTDATNVAAAGAVMEADTSTASMSFVVDEDNMASNSATKVPTQQSVKAYADTKAAKSDVLWVPAALMGAASGGSPAFSHADDVPAWLLDASTQEQVGLIIELPSHWTTFDAQVVWGNVGGGSGNVVWVMAYRSGWGDGEIAGVNVAGSNVTAAAPTSPFAKYTSCLSGIAVPSAGEMLTLRVTRVAGNAADTLGNDAGVLAVRLTRAS